MAYKIQKLGVGGILDQAVSLTKNHFGLLFGIMLIVYLPANLVGGFAQLSLLPPPPGLGDPPEVINAYNEAVIRSLPINAGIGLLLVLVVLPLTNAAIISAIATVYLGEETTPGKAIKFGLSRMMPLIGTSILYGLAVMGGMILLIIPGILFALWFALSTHVVVLEDKAGPSALGRSRELVRPHLGTMIVLSLLLFVIGACIGTGAAFIPQPHIQLVVTQLLQAGLTIFGAAAMVVFYFSCRCAVENFDLQYLANSVGSTAAPVEEDDQPGGF